MADSLDEQHEPLAQLVEHLTFNQGVEGSSPSWLIIYFCYAVVVEWQTRYLEGVVSVRSWRFESSRPHQWNERRSLSQ